MNITFIGNCQAVSLCFYFQRLLISTNYNVCWVLYDDLFKQHLHSWSYKCENKIVDYETSIERIKISDVIIYQEIDVNKSSFCNEKKLQELIKNDCKLIKIPVVYLNYDTYDSSIKDLQQRENKNNVDIKVSDILEKYRNKKLIFGELHHDHPTTFLFLEIMKKLCILLNIDFFAEEEYNDYLKNDNFMELPY